MLEVGMIQRGGSGFQALTQHGAFPRCVRTFLPGTPSNWKPSVFRDWSAIVRYSTGAGGKARPVFYPAVNDGWSRHVMQGGCCEVSLMCPTLCYCLHLYAKPHILLSIAEESLRSHSAQDFNRGLLLQDLLESLFSLKEDFCNSVLDVSV